MKNANRRLKIVATAAGVAAGLSAMLAWSMGDAETTAAVPPRVITVHVDGHGGNGIAKNINEMHVKMTAKGWDFADMESHAENGDTEGAWLTYTKP